MIAWSVFCVAYNDVFIRLETIGGNLYFNIAIISAVEISASFISGILSLKFSISLCIKLFMMAEMVFGVLFLFAPLEVKQLSSLESFLLLLIMMCTKFFADLINNLINLFAPKIFTDEFIGLFLVFSRLSSRFFLVALPYINYGFEILGIHPFFLLTILWGFCLLLALKTEEIQEEGIHDVLNEFKVNLATRASVICSSEHLNVDDVLSNIMINDQSLSDIRTSRILLKKTKSQYLDEGNKSFDFEKDIKVPFENVQMTKSLEMRLLDKE